MKLSDLNPNDIQSISPPPSTKKGGMRLSDLDPSEIVDVAIPEEKGLLSKTLEGLDRYGAAPLRAAYGKAQDSMLKKGVPLDVVGAAKAAYDQFGDDPEKAPTAAQLVEQNPLGSVLNKQGFKESFATHPTAVGLRGLMAPFTGWDRSGEIVGEVPRVAAETLVAGETDPISYIPGAVIERPLVAAGKQVAKVAPGLVNRSAGAAEFFTGVPKESWKNYITRNKQVKDLEKTFGPQVQDAADSMREGWNKAIKARKDQLGLEIEQAVMAAPKKANISTDPILAELNNVKMGLNPNIPEHLAAMNEIDQHIQLVKSLGPEGKLTARDAFDLQKTLQGRGRKAYSVNGALFNPSHQSAKAARDAAALTRKSVNKAMPGVAKANEAFSALHDIDDTVRPSLLTPGKSNAGLMGAVGKIQNQDTVALRDLGDWLGKDLVGETRDFATYKHMQGLGADAADKTGKAVYRAMMGGLLGAGGGYASSDDAKIGLIAGGLAGSLGTNPKLWRGALDTAMGAKDIVKGVAGKGGLIEKGIESAGPTVEALKKRMKGAGNAAKEFIKDEEGKFSPEDLFKILKPGEENVFDLKTARGMAGEPKRGLLEPKGTAPANLVVNKAGFREPTISRTDRAVAKELIKKVEQGAELTEKERAFFTDLEARARSMGAKDFLSELQSDWSKAKANSWAANNEKVTSAYEAAKPVESPKGLLTSLDVERGPVKELPEAGKLVDTVRENVGEKWVAGKRVGGIHKAEIGPHAGKEFTLTGKTGEANEASNWNTLHEIKFKDGQSEWLTSDEIFHMTDPESYKNPYVPSVKVGKYEVGHRSVAVDRNGNYWRIKSIDPKSGSVDLMLEKQTGGMREANLPNEKTVSVDEIKNWRTAGEHWSFIYQGDKAAEAEHMKKGLIGVDFGGRGGKVPKEKAPTFPKDAKFQKNQEVTYDGRPAKVVQYDGNGVYTVKVGNSHQQVHMSELKGGKGKPKKKK